MAKRFTQPTFGNVRGIGSPLNSVKNLQRRMNRQARAGLIQMVKGALKPTPRDV